MKRMVVRNMVKMRFVDSLPFAKQIGIKLDSMEDGTAQCSLEPRPELNNHMKTMHAGATYTLAETASGAAMAGIFAERLLELRIVAAKASIEYRSVSGKTLIATGKATQSGDALRAELSEEGKVRFDVQVEVRDVDDVLVAEMTVEWGALDKKHPKVVAAKVDKAA